MAATSNGASSTDGSVSEATEKLEVRFPVNTSWQLTLQSNETVRGRVYCTDEISQTVVLQNPLTHTVLASEIRIVHAASIVKAVKEEEDDTSSDAATPLNAPLPKIDKKALEERERRAVRMAEESFRHINQKATPEGQAIFDRLLKACSEAVWKGESILVLNQIQVDPPYGPDDCKILQQRNGGSGNKNALDDHSLDRVKKIVSAAASSASNS